MEWHLFPPGAHKHTHSQAHHSAPRHCCHHNHPRDHTWKPKGCMSLKLRSETARTDHKRWWLHKDTESKRESDYCVSWETEEPDSSMCTVGGQNQDCGHSRHSCSSLISPQSLSLSHFQMLLMHLPFEHRYWFGRQVCSIEQRESRQKKHQCYALKRYLWNMQAKRETTHFQLQHKSGPQVCWLKFFYSTREFNSGFIHRFSKTVRL